MTAETFQQTVARMRAEGLALIPGFLAQHTEWATDRREIKNRLYTMYARYCHNLQKRPVGKVLFGRALKARGAVDGGRLHGEGAWRGVGLINTEAL